MVDRRRLGSTLLLMFAFVACSGAQRGKAVERSPAFVPAPLTPPLIRLARAGTGACPGLCPSYSVEVDVDGGVSYAGVINVKTIGLATGHLSPQALQQLRVLMAKVTFKKFPTDHCACGCVKDAATVKLTTWDDKGAAKTVTYDKGCERVPHAVRVLEDAVDDVVGIEQWIGTIQQRRICFEEQRDCSDFGTPEPLPTEEPDAGR